MGSDLSSTGLLHSTGARPRAAAPGLLCGRGGGFDAALGAGCFLVAGAPAAAEAGRGRRAGWRTGAARDAARSATLWPCVGSELLGLLRVSGCGPRGPPRCPISAAFDLAAGRRKSGAERLGPTDDTRTPRACPIWLCAEAPSLAACDSRDIILQAMKKFQSRSFKSSALCRKLWRKVAVSSPLQSLDLALQHCAGEPRTGRERPPRQRLAGFPSCRFGVRARNGSGGSRSGDSAAVEAPNRADGGRWRAEAAAQRWRRDLSSCMA